MRSRYLSISLALACLWGCATSGVQEEERNLPYIGSLKVTRYRLKNGLTLLVYPDSGSPTFAYQTWFRIGSRDEVLGKTGLAHLFEHMMFRRSKNYPDGEFDRILEEVGAEEKNAFTSNDYTAYIQELPKSQLDMIAKLEAERMENLIVDDSAFTSEREVVQNERRFRYENSPDGTMYHSVKELAFQKHPYRWPVIGYAEDLSAMSAEDARSFYKKFYAPNRAVIVVAGDVDPDTVFRTIQKYYQHLKPGPKGEQLNVEEPPSKGPRSKRLSLELQVEKLMLAYRIPEVNHRDIAAIEILQGILTEGRFGRLQRSLVDAGVASSVTSGGYHSIDPTLFIFTVDLQKGKKAHTASSTIERELERLSKEEPTVTEMDRAKNLMNFSYFSSLDSNGETAETLGRYETVAGNFQRGSQIFSEMETVSAQDVKRVASLYFNRDQMVVVTGVPK